jgi:UDP-2,3-diacylglucosamine hydrolase
MLPSPCYVISDAHLGAGDVELERRLVGFLRQLPGRAGSLLINGDLFDFWFEWRTVIPRGHFRTLAALADLVDAGVPVTMLAGNHDCWGGEVLTGEVGIDYRVSGWSGEIAGWPTTIEHGDGLRDVEDRPYRRLRAVLRHPLAIRAFRWIHPDIGSKLAHGSSGASRDHRARDGGAGLQAVAMAHLAQHPRTRLLIYGHSHVPALERSPSGSVYANPGAWMDAPTYLCITPERVELRRWRPGSTESDLLHAADRVTEEALPHP